MNGRGDIVGWAHIRRGPKHAVLWRGGTLADIGPPGKRSEATAINASGEVVGWAGTRAGGVSSAFLWRNGRATNIGAALPSQSYATAINNRGAVVGDWRTRDYPYRWGGFYWYRGKLTDLGTLGGSFTRPFALNERGEVVGVSWTADGTRHAFLWKAGRMRDLGPRTDSATDINDSSTVVGCCSFRWRNGRITKLPASDDCLITNADLVACEGVRPVVVKPPPNRETVTPLPARYCLCGFRAVDETGQIVGLAQPPLTGPHEAFLWEWSW
ncbi:MAG: hypothetical protein ACRDO9_11380 [Gaiellales bacterium]